MHPIDRHLADHLHTIEALRSQRPVIVRIGELIVDCLRQDGCVFWLGNGGSAADCQHLAAELVGRFERDRRGLASVALTTDTSALTSIANDYGFEQVFARQVEALCRPGDLVIGISTSGNTPNVLAAIETATRNGIATAGLSGPTAANSRRSRTCAWSYQPITLRASRRRTSSSAIFSATSPKHSWQHRSFCFAARPPFT